MVKMNNEDKLLNAQELDNIFKDCETLDALGFEPPLNSHSNAIFNKNHFFPESFSTPSFVERFLSSPFTDKKNILKYIDQSIFDNLNILFTTMFSQISLKEKEKLLPYFKESIKYANIENVKNFSPKVNFNHIPQALHQKLFNNLSEQDVLKCIVKSDSYSRKVFQQFTPDTIKDDSLFRNIFILTDEKYDLHISDIPVAFHLRSNDWWRKNSVDFFHHLLQTTYYYQFKQDSLQLIEHLDNKFKIIISIMLHSLNPASDIVNKLMEDESLDPKETARFIAIATLCSKDVSEETTFTQLSNTHYDSFSKNFILLFDKQVEDYHFNNFHKLAEVCKDTHSIYSVDNSFFKFHSHKGWSPLFQYMNNFDLTINDLNFDENTSLILKRMLFLQSSSINHHKKNNEEVYEMLLESLAHHKFQFDGDSNQKLDSEDKIKNLFYTARNSGGSLLFCHEFLEKSTQQRIIYNESPETLFQKISPFADELLMKKTLGDALINKPSLSVTKRKF